MCKIDLRLPQAHRNMVVLRPPTVVQRSLLSCPPQLTGPQQQQQQQLQPTARLQGQPPQIASMPGYSFLLLAKV